MVEQRAHYLADKKEIYEYRIFRQYVVKSDDVSVLNSTKQAGVLIFTSLYPNTHY
ncbi:hypothetical protein FD11_GL001996 [Ligilactobacillus pobuzihii E100301 = KCTC 13174]|uniref:Uncharacterized protein n=1 Tax=Ligilactobacillus pobuzihii TaxID=449659 RepID=A0A0R2LK24_9LACO|nr:hypothetical protein [Ligilactobacillus pobuzihii]KRK10248.1 hypothetical protein FD11_GL001996 [Ligilactobacillus pobuzihii E100301 = KCTC 13174]KRO02079.1 hypothetical protein IV66_GL001749 [Ligilactobacillus pobuzihii]GEN48163.1 hypothetical protein LPO01_09550 [Ligilactobacillus pobuzihii]